MLVATWFTAVATGLLAIFAVITAYFAKKAFNKQSEEVCTIQEQVKGQERVNSEQIRVLELQYCELRESLEERKREADERRRAQAECIGVTWTNNKPSLDDHGAIKSMVTVINGSRRPIRNVQCKAYTGVSVGEEKIQIELDYSDELMPDPGAAGSFTFPSKPYLSPWIGVLRSDTRAGFQFQGHKPAGPLAYALVKFTDDAGNHWSLSSNMSLRLLDSLPD
jgi:hypothetical protein